jgi:CTD kinase subunit beta
MPEHLDGTSPRPAGADAIPDPPSIHPSFIQVAKPYIFESTIQKCIAAMGVNPLREEALRLQGVTWIDNVRRALNLYAFRPFGVDGAAD